MITMILKDRQKHYMALFVSLLELKVKSRDQMEGDGCLFLL